MKRRRRIYFTDQQNSEIWKRGESMSTIRRLFDHESSSIFQFAVTHGRYSSACEDALTPGFDTAGDGSGFDCLGDTLCTPSGH